jgi:hypothetical protein
MTVLLGEVVLHQVLVPTEPIIVFRKTTEAVVHHLVEEEVLGVAEATEATMEAQAMVLMIKVLLTIATTTGLKIHSIKILTVGVPHRLNTELQLVQQMAIIRVSEILKVRLKLRLK